MMDERRDLSVGKNDKRPPQRQLKEISYDDKAWDKKKTDLSCLLIQFPSMTDQKTSATIFIWIIPCVV